MLCMLTKWNRILDLGFRLERSDDDDLGFRFGRFDVSGPQTEVTVNLIEAARKLKSDYAWAIDEMASNFARALACEKREKACLAHEEEACLDEIVEKEHLEQQLALEKEKADSLEQKLALEKEKVAALVSAAQAVIDQWVLIQPVVDKLGLLYTRMKAFRGAFWPN